MRFFRRKPARTFDRDQRARELGYDPDACARGEHQWYVSWGFCQNPFCEALMPGLVRIHGRPTCPECGVVTTSGTPHAYGCSIGATHGYVDTRARA